MKKVLVALMVALFIGGALGCKKQVTPTSEKDNNTSAPVEAPK